MRIAAFCFALSALSLFVGCSTAPQSTAAKANLEDSSSVAINQMKMEDPGLSQFLQTSRAYAIFPSVGKGGVIAGGAYGRGTVHQNGQLLGYADLTQATIGAQLGGQSFSELIVFQDQAALDRFMSGKLAFAANASAVALKSGAASSAKYSEGVAIFVRPEAGLMAEAAVGGQQFTFQTPDQASRAQTASDVSRP